MARRRNTGAVRDRCSVYVFGLVVIVDTQFLRAANVDVTAIDEVSRADNELGNISAGRFDGGASREQYERDRPHHATLQ